MVRALLRPLEKSLPTCSLLSGSASPNGWHRDHSISNDRTIHLPAGESQTNNTQPGIHTAAGFAKEAIESAELQPKLNLEATMKPLVLLAIMTGAALTTSNVLADPVSVKALVGAPKDSVRMNFDDGSKHFVLMVNREGSVEGSGVLAGTSVTEYGWHDVNPPAGADPQGYFQFKTATGDIANVKWSLRAVFLKGEEKPKLVNAGVWELVSGTGQFEKMTGVGRLTLEIASKTDRLFILEGDIGSRP